MTYQVIMAPTELSKRLLSARRLRGMLQRHVAEHFKISVQSVSQWESGATSPEQERLPLIAQFYNVSPLWLAFGMGLPEQDENATLPVVLRRRGGTQVPRVDQALAARNAEAAMRQAVSYTSARFPCSDRAFEVLINDDSNAPEIRQGHAIVFDPDRPATPGKMVFASVGERRTPLIRKLRLSRLSDGRTAQILEPLNGDWDSHTIDPSTDFIIGTETERAQPA